MALPMPSSFASRGMMKGGLFFSILLFFFVALAKMGRAPSMPAAFSESSSSPSTSYQPGPYFDGTYPAPRMLPNGTWTDMTGLSQQDPSDLSEEAVRFLCNEESAGVHPDRRTRKVYDLFLVGSELDWLEIRLNTLAPVVDYFVIVESSQTFSNHPKPLYFKENFHRFEKFANQIIYRVINFNHITDPSPWIREKYQRNALFEEVFPYLAGEQVANDGDVIMVSDLDEIPKEETIALLKHCYFPPRVTMRSRFYYYSFQWEHRGADWNHPQATYYMGNDTIRPQDLRLGAGFKDLKNAGWHCSSCFSTVAEMSQKIESFSHTEYNRMRFKDPAQIVRRVRNGLDLFDRKAEVYVRVDNNTDLPTFLKTHRTKYPWLVDRDPPNANFIDFKGEGAKSLDDFHGDKIHKR